MELSQEYHREEINKDKEAWQQKQAQVNLMIRISKEFIYLFIYLFSKIN
jgi:hypothetical protein